MDAPGYSNMLLAIAAVLLVLWLLGCAALAARARTGWTSGIKEERRTTPKGRIRPLSAHVTFVAATVRA